jgi:hypothetical protein
MPKRIIERVGDEVYGPDDVFPYVIKDAGKRLAELFGKEILKRGMRCEQATTRPKLGAKNMAHKKVEPQIHGALLTPTCLRGKCF